MTGQAEQVKRKKPQMRQGCRRGLPTRPHHDWVPNRPAPALTVNLLMNHRLSGAARAKPDQLLPPALQL